LSKNKRATLNPIVYFYSIAINKAWFFVLSYYFLY